MSTLHRALATLASSALALSLVSGGVAAAGPAARAVNSSTQAKVAGSWLAGQLTHGLIHNGQYDFDDYGLTADTAIALRAIGGHTRAQTKIRHALAKHVADYTAYKKSVFAGSVAKLLVVAQQNGTSGRHFGGTDLVRRLANRVIVSGPAKGRIQDKGASDYANVIGQIFAARGLSDGRGKHRKAATSFLLAQQCSAGYLRLDFAKSKTSAKQSCDAGTKASSAPDTDVTALFVIETAGYGQATAVATARQRAVAWLAKHQGSNGSFGGGTTTRGANTNSTGLAAWAFGLTGECVAARNAAAWVAGKEVRSARHSKLSGENGAIAYDGSALEAGYAQGITVKTRDQWRRATAQAAPGLIYLAGGRCLG